MERGSLASTQVLVVRERVTNVRVGGRGKSSGDALDMGLHELSVPDAKRDEGSCYHVPHSTITYV